jgi:S1-C subfamily serine protease
MGKSVHLRKTAAYIAHDKHGNFDYYQADSDLCTHCEPRNHPKSMKSALSFAVIIFMLQSANSLAQQLQKPAAPMEKAPQIPQPRLDIYAQDLLRQSYQANPISPDVLTKFGQGMARQAQSPPQAVQQYSGMQPSEGRMQYNALIEQRFNQLAQAAGGEQELIDTGIYDQVRQKAVKDVEMLYGPPPSLETELQRVQLEQAKLALEETKLALEAAKVKAKKEAMTRDVKPRDKSEARDVTRENLQESRPEATGSGFFITNDGYLITNQHVAGRGATARVLTASGVIPAKVIKVDELNDLTLLKAEGKFAELPVALSRSVQLGATVATVGFPNIGLQGFSPKLAKGEIASLAGIQDDARHFQISVPVQPGNSGGALVDERGNVIGVVVAKLSQKAALATSGTLAENVNYAIKSSYLLSFLESVPEVAAKLKEPNTTQRDFEATIKDVEQAAVLVLVY